MIMIINEHIKNIKWFYTYAYTFFLTKGMQRLVHLFVKILLAPQKTVKGLHVTVLINNKSGCENIHCPGFEVE